MTSREFRTLRMVLRKHPDEDSVTQLAEKNEWPLVETGAHPDDELTHEVIWRATPSTTLHYVADKTAACSYVYAKGEQANLTTSIGRSIEDELTPYRLLDLWRRVDVAKDPVRIGISIVRLGIGAPYSFDDETFDRVRRGLSHQDERTRDLSIWATTYSPWPEYRPLLDDVAKYDPVPKLRERAALTLEGYDAAGIGEP